MNTTRLMELSTQCEELRQAIEVIKRKGVRRLGYDDTCGDSSWVSLRDCGTRDAISDFAVQQFKAKIKTAEQEICDIARPPEGQADAGQE